MSANAIPVLYSLFAQEAGIDDIFMAARKQRDFDAFYIAQLGLREKIHALANEFAEVVRRIEEFAGTPPEELSSFAKAALKIFAESAGNWAQITFAMTPPPESGHELTTGEAEFLNRENDPQHIKNSLLEASSAAEQLLLERIGREDLTLPPWFRLGWEDCAPPFESGYLGYYHDFGYPLHYNLPLCRALLSGEVEYAGRRGYNDDTVLKYKYKGEEYEITLFIFNKIFRGEKLEADELAAIPAGLKAAPGMDGSILIPKGQRGYIHNMANFLLPDIGLSHYVNGSHKLDAVCDLAKKVEENNRRGQYHQLKTYIENMDFPDMEALLSAPRINGGNKYYNKEQLSQLSGYYKKTSATTGSSCLRLCNIAAMMLVEMLKMQEAYSNVSGSTEFLPPEQLLEFAKNAVLNELSQIAGQVRGFAGRYV